MPVTCVDFEATAAAAGALLREYGHRRACTVGALHAGANQEFFQRGFRGERTALITGPGAAEMVNLRAALHTGKPTALYLADKNIVPSVLPVLASQGFRVPQDISLVMHDGNDEPYDGFTVPPIASVGPSIQSIGKNLAQRLCRILEGSAASEDTV
jgi:DNA-binding LacI/PurR family transcriptional regulator